MNKQILLIDDDNEEQDIFKEAVKATGIACSCICANSGEEGIKMLETILPDLIFLDVNMPGMNGLQCLQKIKKQDNIKAIPVIIFSTAVDEILIHTATASGAIACIKKTNTVNELTDKLKDFLLPTAKLYTKKLCGEQRGNKKNFLSFKQ